MSDNRVEINLVGGGFSHSHSTSGSEPLFVKWVKGVMTAPITFYVDDTIKSVTNQNTKNYGWLVESKTIKPNLYQWCINNLDELKEKFICLFTHDITLVNYSNFFVLCQSSGKSFIPDGNIYEKSKLLSIVASNKIMCDEHKYRQEIIKKYSSLCDHFGVGFNPIKNKVDGLKDYCFSIAMENGTYPNMFSEKLTDCFMSGTIPIYYGISNIGDFFNKEGIIMLDEFDINDLSFELYESKLKAVKENFKLANDLLVAEDYIYINYLKDEI